MKPENHQEIYRRLCDFVGGLIDEFYFTKGEDLAQINGAVCTNLVRASLRAFLIAKKYGKEYKDITEPEEDPQALFECSKEVIQVLSSALNLADPENSYRIEVIKKEGKE